MHNYENLKEQIALAAEIQKKKVASFIRSGHVQDEEDTDQSISDFGLRQYSTDLKWSQYRGGKISREQAIADTEERMMMRIDQKTSANLSRLDRIAATPATSFFSIAVTKRKDHTLCATVQTETERTVGKTTGYDKVAIAIANALNANDSIRQILCDNYEKELDCTDPKDMCDFSSVPKFHGGDGLSSLWTQLEHCGFVVRGTPTGYNDLYTVSIQ